MAMDCDETYRALVRATLLDVGAKRSKMRGGDGLATDGKAPIEQLMSYVLTQAVSMHASDIHVESMAGGDLRIRVRIDGLLQEWQEPLPRKVAAVFLSCVKVRAKMDVSNKQVPQDGGFHFDWQGRQVDVRVATMPTVEGETMVLRLLLHGERSHRLDELGFLPEAEQRLHTLFHQPSGIVLLVGPMGAGKTTTLYAALAKLAAPETSILTIDDPVEYVLPGVQQVQVNEDAGLTFEAALHHILRMDVEILVVGETRDKRTAELSLEAALTGHRVFTTLHAGDACQAIFRMLEMGIPSYLLAATLRGIVAQRLVRCICPDCQESYRAGAEEANFLGVEEGTELLHGCGCPACHGTGYQGRMVLSEVLVLTEELCEAVATGAHLSEVQRLAKQAGYETFIEDARRKVIKGKTTCAEVKRVLYGS